MSETAGDPPKMEDDMKVQHHARKRHEERMEGPGPGVSIPGKGDARERAQRLVVLGNEAIGRALSENSARFLLRNRQEEGE